MKDIHKCTEVFTPGQPATLTFVERDEVNNQIVDSLNTPGKQIIVYGPSGSGKTTLLRNKLYQIYPAHITTSCTSASTYESILLHAFDALDPYYASEVSSRRKRSVSVKLGPEYFSLKSSISATLSGETAIKRERMIPPQLTPQRLAAFCGAAECCLVLEDFHKVPNQEKQKLSQIMKVFVDAAADYPSTKVVAIGAVDSARQVIQYDAEMRNRVSEVAVPLMTEPQLESIIHKGENLLNMEFQKVYNKITNYSSGLPTICHQLCLNVCFEAGVEHTARTTHVVTKKELDAAFDRHVRDAQDTLKHVFDLALRRHRSRRYDNTRLILQALAKRGETGASHADLVSEIRKQEPDYPAGNARSYLHELQTEERGTVLRQDPVSGKYFFSEPLYLSFARVLFQPTRSKTAGMAFKFLDFSVSSDARDLLVKSASVLKLVIERD